MLQARPAVPALALLGPARTPALPAGPAAAPVPLSLRASTGETRLLSGPMSVGSAPDNDWVLADPYVSHHHLMLVPDGDRLRVSDRGSTNGTFLNGVRIESAELSVGACLRLGETQLRLCAAAGKSLLLGESARMRQLRERIEKLAPTDLTVLILGESGTGKELAARAIHDLSQRRGPFVALNCGALPRELVESELFGHERGAFTGAQRRHLGCFGEADGGTLFLDEIGELPLELQPRFLRALENGTIRPVGGTREVPVDVRIVAATHRNLARAVADGKFREDLYYRLDGAEVLLPPLRERRADIPLLVRHFLQERGGGRLPSCSISEEDLEELARYSWPGNVRELRQAVHRAACLSGPRLTAADILPGKARLSGGARPGGGRQPPSQVPVVGRRFEEIERDIYARVLEETGHNRRAAADMLGIPKSSLCDKLARMGLLTPRRRRGKGD